MRILAHRGSPGSRSTENTVPAVSAALAGGADGVEVDLRLTADGVLAVCHDRDLGRVAGRRLRVADTPWPELEAASRAHGVPLARVEWVLAAAVDRRVVLELKAPPRGPRARARTVEALVERLEGLHAARLPMDLTVSSFDPLLVAAFRRAAPAALRVRTALLGDIGCRPTTLVRQALAAGHDEVHPQVLEVLAHPRSVDAAHGCGLAVVPWTVNGRRAVRRCADLGVDGVITDEPVAVRALLAGRRAAA